jgi:hypothetical protein
MVLVPNGVQLVKKIICLMRNNKDGPMFVIQHDGRKYQFHNASYQFMDEKNNEC